MANDDTADVGNPGIDAHPVAKEKGVAESRLDQLPGRATLAVSLTDLMRLFDGERELAPLAVAPPEVRLARLESKSRELEWAVYVMLGLFLALWLLRR